MDRARLDAAIAVPLLSRDFACSYQATLGAMPMTALNPLFVKDNLIIEEGDLKSIALEAQARNGVAHGTLTAVYDHLKIKLVKPDDKKKERPITWLANLFLRNKNRNPYRTPTGKLGKTDYERVPGDDFFRFMWRSARNGLLDIMLPGIQVPFPPD